MPQSKILIDTNTYIRLAQSIRPLLFMPFGDSEYCLYILQELNDELSNRRLKSKFPWVDEGEYEENRKHFPTIGRNRKNLFIVHLTLFGILFKPSCQVHQKLMPYT
jgi:hypothetical protein